MTEVARAEARDITESELDDLVKVAFQADVAIKAVLTKTRTDMWELAARFHDFDANKRWKYLGGYESLSDYLAEPEVGISRSQFYALIQAWEQIVVLREGNVEELRETDWSKMRLLLPQITSNALDVETAISEAKVLGWHDLREKYGPQKPDPQPDPDPPADHSDEIVEGTAKSVTVDEEPVKASDLEPPDEPEFDPDTARHGHFDGPEDPDLEDKATYEELEVRLTALEEDHQILEEETNELKSLRDIPSRCPHCSAELTANDLIPEPVE